MCGRYTMSADGDQIAQAFELQGPVEVKPRFNIAPTSLVPCVRLEGGQRRLVELRWGLVPSWAKEASIGTRLINARIETLFEKPSFKGSLEKRRCLVIATGFYEWVGQGKARRPVLLRFADDHPFAFAGLWAHWQPREGGAPIESCTIVTTAPNPLVARVHDRMPLTFDPVTDREWIAQWLDVTRAPDLAALRAPRDLPGFHFYPVDKRVGNVRNDDPACASATGPLDTLPLGAA